jgi:hypothetical protein
MINHNEDIGKVWSGYTISRLGYLPPKQMSSHALIPISETGSVRSTENTTASENRSGPQ